MTQITDFKSLIHHFEGELFTDDLMRKIYATDASVYRRLPLAVAIPKHNEDLKTLIHWAYKNKTSLIPRTAGTSLAGQCVGDGIVVDVSKHFTEIGKVDRTNKTVTVQPGVVRDQLNNFLKSYGLFFGPNTSTSNRAMIGGMVGNNSSGTTSIQYGVTRHKIESLTCLLSDGSEVKFSELSKEEFLNKTHLNSVEGRIYKSIYELLRPEYIQEQIKGNYPKKSIHRRNTGYALDELIEANVFKDEQKNSFNFSKLIAGSEGTLAFITDITLKLDDLPPPYAHLVILHFNSISDCLASVDVAMQHNLYSCEMLDDTILNLTKHNKSQQENRQLISGDPVAILMCELRATTKEELQLSTTDFLETVDQQTSSYASPVLKGEAIVKLMDLRKAGLGLLGNMVGDKKAVACIEDTAVDLVDLEAYINKFTALMKKYDQKAVYYAHAGAGELHLRPILNLKQNEDVKHFRQITTEVAHLVKSFGGSMSGEHGDGIVRAEFIPLIIGEDNFQLVKRVKQIFDPNNLFNPGKIVAPYAMDEKLRYKTGMSTSDIATIQDFSSDEGILRSAEKCNGSGDCRKLPEFGGTMCPSYRATRNEKDTTRARANALREFLTHSDKNNKFDHEELKVVFQLCLSCKACKTECPSSVDVAALKAEFLYHYQKENGVALNTKLIAHNYELNKMASLFPRLSNWVFSSKITSKILKKVLGFSEKRSLPKVSSISLNKWYNNFYNKDNENNFIKEVILFNDEFTNYLDTAIGQDAIELLTRLNYKVRLINHTESGRAFISKGLLEEAKSKANENVELLKGEVHDQCVLIGIEPSAIYSFKDDYLRLADNKTAAKNIAKHTYLIEAFLQQEIKAGFISVSAFTKTRKTIKFHGHCYQKALENQMSSFEVLNLPENYKVTIIPSGCCGMAGSFGYEKDTYDVSMAIGEQTLFPAIKKAGDDVIIAANGTSCRHQIKDGTGRIAKHPVTILKEALR